MIEMSPNPTSTHKLNPLRRVYCSQTNKLVVAEVSQVFDIPNGQVAWLQCEACRGWHIVIDNYYPEEFTPPSTPTPTLNPMIYFGDN